MIPRISLPHTPEMPQQPAEVIPLLASGTERTSTPTQEILPPATPTAESTIVPLSSTPTPEDSPRSPSESLIQSFISWRLALLGLAVIILVGVCLAIISECPRYLFDRKK